MSLSQFVCSMERYVFIVGIQEYRSIRQTKSSLKWVQGQSSWHQILYHHFISKDKKVGENLTMPELTPKETE